ncbi:NAD(P)/FAD-dependent oxidoreductase [Dactylosporangium sucinum]|uniref:Ferredoxin--NADP reductase n=1 Tax=Dactylosporangium sucinum TaxID=1424081 RepID=A0A917TQK1_9ACTN|nr:NAD(P)/FAD-dependent oxidoreductase [Dactylosporangium sucinum]GGM32451.1 ferredoxin--NADP reductase [Dactylosporangium sucinum]
MREVDLAIVGAGPAGLFAAYYAGFRGLSTAVIDALPEPGGQVTAMYPEKMIFDVAGFPGIRGRDLVANLVEQAAQFNPEYVLGVRADELSYVDDRPVLALSDGQQLRCGAVLITGGLGSFTARPLPAAAEFGGDGVIFFVPHLADLTGHDVVIVGGGDSAFDWALALQPIAKSVTLVHRRDRFRAHASTVAKVQSLPIEIVVNAEVSRIHGEGRCAGVDVTVRGAEPRTLPADTIVAALGFTADLGPLAGWGLELDKRHIKVDSTTATNLPRVFAAGDISEYPGKVRLIAVGFGEAATAVNNAAIIIDPSAHLFPGHSSDNG